MSATTDSELPPIPDKRYFPIGEASDLCRVKPHVLRYWEQEFPQLQPQKRRGNRRYYRIEDIRIARRIRALLYNDGFTIAGARLKLDRPVGEEPTPGNVSSPSAAQPTAGTRDSLTAIRRELESIVKKLDV